MQQSVMPRGILGHGSDHTILLTTGAVHLPAAPEFHAHKDTAHAW